MDCQQTPEKTSKPASPTSTTTTPLALAASSFSLSTPSVSTSSASRSRSGSPAPVILPAAVAYAFDRIRDHYLIEQNDRLETRPQTRQVPRTRGQKEEDTDEEDGWVEIPFTKTDWLAFQAHVASLSPSDLSYVIEEKLRYDYFPELDLLVLRLHASHMPTKIHESLIRKIDLHIKAQLLEVARRRRERDADDTVACFIDHVQPWGSLTMHFDRAGATQSDKDTESDTDQDGSGDSEGQEAADSQWARPAQAEGRHEPDSSWSSERPDDPRFPNDYPGTIIEVICSKKRRLFPHLAEVYLMGTDAGPFVQVVLAIDVQLERVSLGRKARCGKVIEYRRRWQPATAEHKRATCTVQATEHIFRNEAGDQPPCNIQLSLSDFAPCGHDPQLQHEGAQHDSSISLTSEWLNEVLRQAEAEASKTPSRKRKLSEDAADAGGPSSVSPDKYGWPANFKRRWAKSPSEERLTGQDEAHFRRAEDQAESHVERRDAIGARDYEPPSRSARDAPVATASVAVRRSARPKKRPSRGGRP